MRSFSGVQLNFWVSVSESVVGDGRGRWESGTYGWGVAGFGAGAGFLLGRHGDVLLVVVVVVVVVDVVLFECGVMLCGCVVIVGEEVTEVGDERQIRETAGRILPKGRRV